MGRGEGGYRLTKRLGLRCRYTLASQKKNKKLLKFDDELTALNPAGEQPSIKSLKAEVEILSKDLVRATRRIQKLRDHVDADDADQVSRLFNANSVGSHSRTFTLGG